MADDMIRLKVLVPENEDLGYVDITLPRCVAPAHAGTILTIANELMYRVACAHGMGESRTETREIDEHGGSRQFGHDADWNGGQVG